MTGDEELRFAKKQQWYVATSAVTLLGAIFAITRVTKLKFVENAVATIFIALVAGFGVYFLCKLQHHLKRVRLELDPDDKNPSLSRHWSTAWRRSLKKSLIRAVSGIGKVARQPMPRPSLARTGASIYSWS
jgi:O-antigen/teichoic acid export membrane protein